MTPHTGTLLEEELPGQEALLRELTENIHEVFWLASADQRQVFYVSRRYEDVWGRSCASLLRRPMSWLEPIHPEDRPRIEAEVAHDRGARFTREYRIVRPDGAIRWILARGYPVRNKRGWPYRIAGLAEDITERKDLEQALRESRGDLEEAQRVARIGSWAFRIRTNELAWSDELHRIFGLKKSEFGGTYEAFVACVHPEDRKRVLELGAKARAKGQSFNAEYRIVAPQGELKVIHEIARPLRDDAGQVVGLIGTAQDITERKEAERHVQQLAAIVESSNDAILSRDLDGRILTWNRAAERCFGYRAKEIIGQSVWRLVPKGCRPGQEAILEKTRKGERTHRYDTVRLKKDGTQVPVSLTISPVRDAWGKIVGASAIARDLSEAKRAELALAESESRYASLFGNMMEGVAYCRMLFEKGQARDYIYLEVNNAFKALTGRRNVVGRKASEVLPGFREADPEVLVRCGRVARTGQPERFEFYCAKLKMWLSVTAYCPEKEHFIVVLSNITERKLADQQTQMFSQRIVAAQEEERRRVSSALHHDVGSIAVGGAACLDAIEEGVRAGRCGEAARWLKRTRKLLDESVARLKGLAVELRPPALDALGLRPALKQYFSRLAKHPGVRIQFRLKGSEEPLAANASTVLFRVAQEAVTNAIKHGHAKQVNADLRGSKAEIRLTVRDDGKGFDPSKPRARAASGLGLRIMREMAASAGGTFTVDSRPGKGTTVRVRLPVEPAGLGSAQATAQDETTRRGGGAPRPAIRSPQRQKGSRL